MRPPQIRDFKYQDKLASQKRRSLRRKVVFGTFFLVLAAGGVGYLAVFSDVFVIDSIIITGTGTIVDQSALEASIQDAITTRTWGILPLQNNTLFVKTSLLAEKLAREFPAAKTISVDREFMHALRVSVAERVPLGVWCWGEQCSYFDGDGLTWGEPPKSSGFLLLKIKDTRERAENSLKRELLDKITLISEGLREQGIPVKDLTLTQAAALDLTVATGRGYLIYFDLEGDIAGQLESMRIFLDKKSAEPSFAPQYLDLRIEGRVYYR